MTAKKTEAEKEAGKQARKATLHLKKAVAAKAETTPWRGPEHRTGHTGPAETPNTAIAPSGALNAEGMRASISRSTGDR